MCRPARAGRAGDRAPPQHDPGQRPGKHTGSVTLIPHARAGVTLVIERPAPAFTAAAA